MWDRDLDYCEIAVVLLLDGAHKLLGWMKLAEGMRNSASIDPAKLFTIALVTNASAFILAHSHSSGALTPSAADKIITKKLLDGAEFLRLIVIPIYFRMVSN